MHCLNDLLGFPVKHLADLVQRLLCLLDVYFLPDKMEDHEIELNHEVDTEHQQRVPQHEARFKIETAHKKSVREFDPHEIPGVKLDFAKLLQQRLLILLGQVDQNFVHFLDELVVEGVEVVEEGLTDDQVAEQLERLEGRHDQQEHHHQERHSLHILDVGPQQLEHLQQHTRLALDIFELLLLRKVVECPEEVLLDDVLAIHDRQLLLMEQAVKEVLVDPQPVSDQKGPYFRPQVLRQPLPAKEDLDRADNLLPMPFLPGLQPRLLLSEAAQLLPVVLLRPEQVKKRILFAERLRLVDDDLVMFEVVALVVFKQVVEDVMPLLSAELAAEILENASLCVLLLLVFLVFVIEGLDPVQMVLLAIRLRDGFDIVPGPEISEYQLVSHFLRIQIFHLLSHSLNVLFISLCFINFVFKISNSVFD